MVIDIHSALDLYSLRMSRQLSGKVTVQGYYEDLRKIVYLELRNNGRCSLIEKLLQDRMLEWDRPTYEAVVDALEAVHEDREMQEPAEFRPIPLNNYTSRVILEPKQLNSMQVFYEQYVDSRQEQPRQWSSNPFGGASAKNDRQAAKTRAEADKILERAKNDAEKIRDRARSDADKIIRDADNEAARVTAKAIAEKKQAEKEREEASQTLLEARQQAERIRQEAYQEAEQIRQKALKEAKEEAQLQLEEESDQALQRMIGTKFNGYMARQRRQWEFEQPEIREDRKYISQQTALLKEQACGFSNNTSAELTRVMEQAMEQLLAVKASFSTQLQQWKSDMYQCEYNSIISCFNSLLVLEKRFERDVAAEETMTAEEKLTKLQQHSASLTGFRNRLERALNTMGLSLFTPRSGDIFDAYYHTLDSDEEDERYGGQRIAECTSPGIMRKVNSEESVVLQRAAVLLEADEPLNAEDRFA